MVLKVLFGVFWYYFDCFLKGISPMVCYGVLVLGPWYTSKTHPFVTPGTYDSD